MAADELKVGILETGRPPEELLRRHGDYPAMVASWLGVPEAKVKSYGVLDGEIPATPAENDLWIITGSRFGVYEDHTWIAPLEQFIRDCRDAGSKMFGICFGHQIIAQALGGRVDKSHKGWGLGPHDYAAVDWPAKLAPAPENIRIQAFHQDQVVEPPKGAQRIATSPFCENAALWYPGFAVTVQGHPEFGKAYVDDLLTSRRGTLLPECDVDEALARLERETTEPDLAGIVREHWRDF